MGKMVGFAGRKLLTSLIFCVLICLVGCDEPVRPKSSSRIPEQVLSWGNVGTGWGRWGASGNYMYAASVNPIVVEVWKWEKNTMKKRCSLPYDESVLEMAVLSDDKCICYVYHQGPNPPPAYHLIDLTSGKEVGNWNIDDQYADFGRASQNGKYLAIWDVIGSKQFGLMAPDGHSYDWRIVGGIPFDIPLSIRHPEPSNDGRYLAVASFMNGVAMLDLVAKKILWLASFEYRDPNYKPSPGENWKPIAFDEINTNDAAFTPDSKIVYAGGASGCVYGMKVETGEIVSKWWATPSQKQMNGYEITTIAVSPDGRYVAAGTGPSGDVYLFSTKDGQCNVFIHGGSTILMISFSPDSKRLATYASGQIKIWKLPEESAEQQPVTDESKTAPTEP